MDLKTLRHSGVALAVKPYRKHSDAAIATLASELFKGWKVMATAQ